MRKVNIKDFGAKNLIKTDLATTKFNKKGEMYKLRDYENVFEKELENINNSEVFDAKRSKKGRKPKTKRCKCKKK